MPLYLGNDKVKFNLGDTDYRLNLVVVTPSIIGVKLLSSDDYILKDSNGLYLTSKEGE